MLHKPYKIVSMDVNILSAWKPKRNLTVLQNVNGSVIKKEIQVVLFCW